MGEEARKIYCENEVKYTIADVKSKVYGIIKMVVTNGKRFTFRQNEYILRTSRISGGDTYVENKKRKEEMMLGIVVGIVGIIVTVISIIVTVISIRHTDKKDRDKLTSKSNRSLSKVVVAF